MRLKMHATTAYCRAKKGHYMGKGIVFVVSDAFESFAANADVVSYTTLMRAIEAGTFSAQQIVMGQGMDEIRRRTVRRALVENGFDEIVNIVDVHTKPVDRLLVHKRKAENVCIEELSAVGDGRFSSRLMLDDRCADMSDHATGQHIQGTVLIEASRQMMMAGVEMHSFQQTDRGNYQYTLNDYSVTFRQFVFPLQVDIDLCILKHDIDKRGVMSLELTVAFSQLQARVCDAYCIANGYPMERIKRMEAHQAQRTVTAAKNYLLQRLSADSDNRSPLIDPAKINVTAISLEDSL